MGKLDGKDITGYEAIYLSKEKTQQLHKFIGKILKKWEEK